MLILPFFIIIVLNSYFFYFLLRVIYSVFCAVPFIGVICLGYFLIYAVAKPGIKARTRFFDIVLDLCFISEFKTIIFNTFF